MSGELTFRHGIRNNDLEKIQALYTKHHANNFDLPSLSNIVTEAIVERDDRIIAAGTVKLMAEATMILDKDASLADKVFSFRALMEAAIKISRSKGLEELHVFSRDEKFMGHLYSHFGFKPITGQAAVLELTNG